MQDHIGEIFASEKYHALQEGVKAVVINRHRARDTHAETKKGEPQISSPFLVALTNSFQLSCPAPAACLGLKELAGCVVRLTAKRSK